MGVPEAALNAGCPQEGSQRQPCPSVDRCQAQRQHTLSAPETSCTSPVSGAASLTFMTCQLCWGPVRRPHHAGSVAAASPGAMTVTYSHTGAAQAGDPQVDLENAHSSFDTRGRCVASLVQPPSALGQWLGLPSVAVQAVERTFLPGRPKPPRSLSPFASLLLLGAIRDWGKGEEAQRMTPAQPLTLRTL